MIQKVLLITDVTAPGGVDTYFLQLYKTAVKNGWAAHVLMDQSPGSDGLYHSLLIAGAAVTRAPLYHRDHSESLRESATRKVIEIFKPHVAHAVCGAPWCTVVPREAVVDSGIPLHFTEQYVAPGFTFEPALSERISQLYRAAGTVIAVSRNNADLLTERYGFPNDKLVVIPNATPGPNSSLPKPVFPRASRRLFNVVTVARHAHQKGLDVLIDAIALLSSRARQRCSFTLIGDGPLRPRIEQRCHQNGLGDSIHFAGWRADAARLLPLFDLFVLPSRSEGQPFALIEALAAGIPVIGTDASGIPEVLDFGRAGMIVPNENPDALSAAISSFIVNPERFQRLAEYGKRFVQLYYDSETNLQATIEHWRQSLVDHPWPLHETPPHKERSIKYWS